MKTPPRLTRIALTLAAAATLPMAGCYSSAGYHPGYGHYGYYEHSRGGYSGSHHASGDALALYSAIMLTYHATAWLVDCLD